jgi:hypothetical protein
MLYSSLKDPDADSNCNAKKNEIDPKEIEEGQ